MGSNRKGSMPVLLGLMAISIGLLSVGMASQMGVDIPVLSSVGDQPDTGGDKTGTSGDKTGTTGDDTGSDTPVELREVKWANGFTIPLEASLPVSSNVQADIFVAEPDSNGEYGNYVDYNQTQATSGMTQGVDYFHEGGNSITTVTWDPDQEINPGEYKAAIADNSSSGSKEYHDLFTNVTVPETVKFTRYDNDNAKTVISSGQFDRRAAYDSDSYTVYDGSSSSSSAVAFGDKDGTKDLATSAYGTANDETFTIERTLEYTHGVDYLGDLNVISVNGSANSKTEVDVTITAQVRKDNGELVEKTVFDKDVADDSTENDFDESIQTAAGEDSTESDPAIVGDELTMEATVQFDGSNVANGDVLFNSTIQDVYGNNVGSGSSQFISLTS